VRVLGTDTEAKRTHIEAQGAILLDFEHEDIIARCRELTGGRGVDYAFDGIGATARKSLRALRPRGRLVWFGMITFLSQGARDRPKTAKTLTNVALPFAENLRPGGRRTSMYSIQTLARRHPDWYRQDLATLYAMLADGKLAPQIAAVLSLDEVPAALANLAGHGPPGKQVISVAAGDRG
jgi:NADPH:quinone reductase-like Zn-dependent oxidoreductase